MSAALVRPMVGRLGDRVGRRPLAVWGGLLAAVSIAGYGIVASMPALVGFRLLTGLGEAAFFVGVATAAQDLSPDDRRGEAASFFSIAIYGGLAIGPFAGERLYDAHGADVVWMVSAVLAAIGALLAVRMPADLGRADPEMLAAAAAAEAADPRPRFQRWLHPAAVMPGTILLLGLMGFAAFGAFLALHLEDLGIDATGNLFLVYGLTVLVVRIVGAKVPDRFGAVQTTTVSLTAIIVAMVVIGTVDAVPALYVGTVVFSIGMSLLVPALFGLAVNRAPASERSHAVGTFSLFFDLSQGVGAPLLGIAVDATGSDRAAFLTAAAIAAVGLVMARIRLPRATASQAGSGAAAEVGGTEPVEVDLGGGTDPGDPAEVHHDDGVGQGEGAARLFLDEHESAPEVP